MGIIGNQDIETTEVTLTDGSKLRGMRITPSADITISRLTFYTRTYETGVYYKGVITDADDDTIIANGVSDATANVLGYGVAGWQYADYTTKPVLSSGHNYYIFFISSDTTNWFYDSGGASDYYGSDDTNNYTTPTDPTDGTYSATLLVSIYATYESTQEITATLTGTGTLSGRVYQPIFITAILTGEGDLSGETIVDPVQLFIKEPKVTKRGLIATHVIVKSPTNEATAHTTPEPGIATKIERLVKILEGNESVCQEVADELIAKWGKEQISVTGPVDLTVTLLFKQKVLVVIEKANIDTNMILQRKSHNILESSTTVVCGDIILSDDELIARILEGIENQ